MSRLMSVTGELAIVNRYFEYPLEQRLAFREFGTCLGVKCVLLVSTSEFDEDLDTLAGDILDQWEQSVVGSKGDEVTDDALQRQGLKPITKVMYAAALIPGGMYLCGFAVYSPRAH